MTSWIENLDGAKRTHPAMDSPASVRSELHVDNCPRWLAANKLRIRLLRGISWSIADALALLDDEVDDEDEKRCPKEQIDRVSCKFLVIDLCILELIVYM